MATIKSVRAKEVRDSRGTPTLSVTVETETESGSFAVPSGASTGLNEAHELRDGDAKDFSNMHVTKAVCAISKEIEPAILGVDVTKQNEIDSIMCELDGTKQKTRLGGNSLIGVSIACAKTAARSRGEEAYEYLRTLSEMERSQNAPYLFVNLINGGKHVRNVDTSPIQEHQIIPIVDNPKRAYEIAVSVEHTLGEIIKERHGGADKRGDEGGFVLKTKNISEPFDLLKEAIDRTGVEESVSLGLDAAATSFYTKEIQMYEVDGGAKSKEELSELYKNLCDKYTIHSVEDPFMEEDFESFSLLLKQTPDLHVIGDDLTTTDSKRTGKAGVQKSINAIIIKPNQIGTLSETLETMSVARSHGIKCIVSHRSGETMDDFIADLSFAFGCHGLKAGAPGFEERDVKYKRLIAITEKEGF